MLIQNNVSTFMNPIPVLVAINVDDDGLKSLEIPDLKNLEEDVKIEEDYLKFLFNYKKDIHHLIR